MRVRTYLAVPISTYAHLIDEYEDLERIDAEAEIAQARGQGPHQRPSEIRTSA